MTIGDQVARFARSTPDGVAFRDGPLTLTWRQTDARIDRLAAALAAAGVTAGDRVAVMAGNSARRSAGRGSPPTSGRVTSCS